MRRPTTSLTTGFQNGNVGERRYVLVPLDYFPADNRQQYRAYFGRLDTTRLMQLALDSILTPSLWPTRGDHGYMNRILESAGLIPGSVDFRKVSYQVMNFVERTQPVLIQALDALDIPFEPTLKVAGTEKEFLVIGYQASNDNDSTYL